MKKRIGIAAFAAAFLVIAAVASATTTFDPISGHGFVGKGDVQVPWGWSDQTLQAQALNVAFTYSDVQSSDRDVTCEWDTGNVHVTHHVQTTTKSIADGVAYDVKSASRTNPRGKVTGFNLNGPNGDPVVTQSGDPIPALGDDCPGNSGLGPVTAVSDPYNVVDDSSLKAADAIAGTGPTTIWANGLSVQP